MIDNILIADDSPELLEMIRHIYARRKIFLATAQSREEIFDVLKRIRPDLILMDVTLGEDDGRLICNELKSMNEFQKIPIILMSGDKQKLAGYLQVQADDILEKPFSMEAILSIIKTVVEKNS
jgi:two-component system OmpR family response regulator